MAINALTTSGIASMAQYDNGASEVVGYSVFKCSVCKLEIKAGYDSRPNHSLEDCLVGLVKRIEKLERSK